jgi:phosphate butyryltransferase
MIDVTRAEAAAQAAAKMAQDGEIGLIITDQSATESAVPVLLDESLNLVAKGKTVSHVAVLKPEKYKKLMFLSDGLVVPQPDLKTKLGMIQNIIGVAGVVGVDQPRIALLAAVEVVYPQMPVTMEAAVISKMAERGQVKGAYVDGPLSFDVAMDMLAAYEKGITSSQVAGQADGFLAPNIEVAGGVYIAMTVYGHCEAGGVVAGARVPIATAGYTDSVETRFNSILLGVLAA